MDAHKWITDALQNGISILRITFSTIMSLIYHSNKHGNIHRESSNSLSFCLLISIIDWLRIAEQLSLDIYNSFGTPVALTEIISTVCKHLFSTDWYQAAIIVPGRNGLSQVMYDSYKTILWLDINPILCTTQMSKYVHWFCRCLWTTFMENDIKNQRYDNVRNWMKLPYFVIMG